MSDNPAQRLSPRQRECLRLVYRRKSSKEIAAELGISEGTVNSYLAEAIHLLGARNRRDASDIFAAMEAPNSPEIIPPQNHGVSVEPTQQPLPAQGGKFRLRDLLPLRTQGAAGNDLNVLIRFGWIFAIAVGLSIGFGALSNGLGVVSTLVSSAAS